MAAAAALRPLQGARSLRPGVSISQSRRHRSRSHRRGPGRSHRSSSGRQVGRPYRGRRPKPRLLDVDPRQVIHLPCDGMAGRDLRRALTLGRDLTEVVDNPDGARRVRLLDEVSTITGWTAIIKAARDGTALGDDTMVVTGSRWQEREDLLGNLMTGRAGTGSSRRIRHLHPMSFRSFLEATRSESAHPSSTHLVHLQDPSVASELEALSFDVDAYDLAWQDYLTCGGFPRAVFEHHRIGNVSAAYLREQYVTANQ